MGIERGEGKGRGNGNGRYYLKKDGTKKSNELQSSKRKGTRRERKGRRGV